MTDYQLGNISDWSALILPQVYEEVPYKNGDGDLRMKRRPKGYVFVTDPKYGPRAQWKLPAGHKADGESPLETAMRELLGETNLSAPIENFRYIDKWIGWRKDHWKMLFLANIEESELGWMNDQHPENEGEQPKFFTTEEFYALVREGKFMREHYEKLVEFATILPFSRDRAPQTTTVA